MTTAQLGCLCLLTLYQTTVYGQEVIPRGPLKPMTLSVPEGEVESFEIFQFITNPPAANFQLSGETDNIININSDGVLRHIIPLDREKRPVHHLQVIALDAQGKTVEGPVSITIRVEDINDNTPVFPQSLYYASVRQNSRPGKPFIYVNATDKDDPATPNGQLTYEILVQFPMVNNIKYFEISNTGGISLTREGSEKLDSTENGAYNLVVLVKDMAKNPLSHTTNVHITVKENIWKAPETVEIKENSTDPHPIRITQVQWNDPGAHYSLIEKEKLPRFPFSIDQEGVIYVTEPLDREEKDSYSFYAVAKDNSGKPLASPLNIRVKVKDINDNPPTCPSAVTVFEVQENEHFGSNIGIFTAHDMDEKNSVNSILTYRLVGQAPQFPSSDLFMIQKFTGVVQLAKHSLKKKDSPQYNLTVMVSDIDFNTSCFLQVNIIDINDQIPIFEKSDYGNLTLAEDTAVGSTILTIQATDEDEPFTGSSNIVYRIIEGDSGGRLDVETDPQTNAGYVIIKKPLDFEATTVHNIVFQAENPEPLVASVKYNASSTARFKLIVTDVNEAPQFSNYFFLEKVPEDVPVGTKVGNVTAWDPEHLNISYSLTGDTRGWLRIDSKTGEIFSVASLDRETESLYRVQVVASEVGGPLSSQVEFQLALQDVNDNPPRLIKDYHGLLILCHPLKERGHVIFEATDDDLQPYRGPRFTFFFGKDSFNENWELSKLNGTHATLSTKHTNFEEKVYDVEVRISDGGQPPLDGTVYVPVTFCKCESAGSCYRPTGNQEGMPTVGIAVGVLLTTFLVIGIILTVVFVRLKKGGDDDPKLDPKPETQPLRS
ncbi:PREDICTED: cadherin-17 [Condylura cristata]|uniref:cadherin-17 n=1 Tax=Condylura cristata TaxID=143302 RepID=UPI000334350B|nr:PREDICTED: cadherin-17 [Condylura cristata]